MLNKLDGDFDIIAKLDDEPNDIGGLTARELKERFDRAGKLIRDFLNNTLIPQIEERLQGDLAAHENAGDAHRALFARKLDSALFNAHTADTDNPHGVTAEQIGAETRGRTDAHNRDAGAHGALFAAKADQTALTAHTENQANPHKVTAAQIGAEAAGSTDRHNQDSAAHAALFRAKQDRLTGTAGQVVGFDEQGQPVAVAVPGAEGMVIDMARDLEFSEILTPDGEPSYLDVSLKKTQLVQEAVRRFRKGGAVQLRWQGGVEPRTHTMEARMVNVLLSPGIEDLLFRADQEFGQSGVILLRHNENNGPDDWPLTVQLQRSVPPVAAVTRLGGVKANPAKSWQKTPVGVDANGFLKVQTATGDPGQAVIIGTDGHGEAVEMQVLAEKLKPFLAGK